VTAVVAAYNEATRISKVLEVLTTYPGFDEVLVVDDGSQDSTAVVSALFPVRILKHKRNQGKGNAMETGVRAATADIIFFCDADVRGLSHQIISETIDPVRVGRFEMMVAVRNRAAFRIRPLLMILPLLGGERAVTRRLWDHVPDAYKQRYLIETALNRSAREPGLRGIHYQVFSGLAHTVKERKYGWIVGLTARICMVLDIAWLSCQLHCDAIAYARYRDSRRRPRLLDRQRRSEAVLAR
jgi:glycosyltransferase involved in cell wall biosynthesis